MDGWQIGELGTTGGTVMRGILSLFAAAFVLSAVGKSNADWTGIFPEGVRTIGIPAPASIISAAKLTNGVAMLEKAGYRVKLGRHTADKVQPSAEDRAKDFADLWMDKEVDLILCARGGRGAEDVLPLLDWEKLRTRKMTVLGFSNVTHILNAMLKKGVGHPYSSTLLTSLQYSLPETRSRLRKVLDGATLEPVHIKPLRAGTVEGMPIGGHVVVFSRFMAGEYALDTKGKVIFLECGGSKRPVSAVKTAFDELLARKVFDRCAGVVLCDFTNCGTKSELNQVFAGFVASVKCPVYSGYPYGHVPRSYAIDFHRVVSIDSSGLISWK